MKTGILSIIFLAVSALALAQPDVSRATLQQMLSFEDQTSIVLTGWHAYPPDTVSADDTVSHTGRWSVRLKRCPKTRNRSMFPGTAW